MTAYRVGSGFDSHRLVPGRPLLLGGTLVPYDQGLEGHSDGDCLVHALCDALLGAAGAGDMGAHFPSTDPHFKGTPSLAFLTEVARMVRERGYAVENADVTVIAEAPPIAPHADRIRTRLSATLGVPPDAIGVKAKTADGMGALGRGEGIAAIATVLLRTKDPA